MPEYPDLLVCESTFYAIWVESEIIAIVIVFFFFVGVVSVFGWGGRVVTCWCLVAEEMLGLEGLKVVLGANILVGVFLDGGKRGKAY